MNFEFKYLGEFELLFDNILGCESGAHIWSIRGKKQGRKYHASLPLSLLPTKEY
jgi:hypothetical protein